MRVDTDKSFDFLLRTQFTADMANRVTDLMDPALFLKSVGESYYRQFGAIVAKLSLMEPTSTEIKASATFMANRLVVREWAAQWMAGLAAICLALAVMLLLIVDSKSNLVEETWKVLPYMY